MAVFMIDKNIREGIAKLKKIAEANVINIYEMHESGELEAGEPNPIGDDSDHVMIIPIGLKVVFSLEDQGNGVNETGQFRPGVCRHFSISSADNKVPTIESIDMIVREFGFSPLYKCVLWPENPKNSGVMAINVLEPMDGFPDKIIGQVKQAFIEQMDQIGKKGYGEEMISIIDKLREL